MEDFTALQESMTSASTEALAVAELKARLEEGMELTRQAVQQYGPTYVFQQYLAALASEIKNWGANSPEAKALGEQYQLTLAAVEQAKIYESISEKPEGVKPN